MDEVNEVGQCSVLEFRQGKQRTKKKLCTRICRKTQSVVAKRGVDRPSARAGTGIVVFRRPFRLTTACAYDKSPHHTIPQPPPARPTTTIKNNRQQQCGSETRPSRTTGDSSVEVRQTHVLDGDGVEAPARRENNKGAFRCAADNLGLVQIVPLVDRLVEVKGRDRNHTNVFNTSVGVKSRLQQYCGNKAKTKL